MNNVSGFLRETLVAVITNTEGREYYKRRISYDRHKPENPRASSTDDVEL